MTVWIVYGWDINACDASVCVWLTALLTVPTSYGPTLPVDVCSPARWEVYPRVRPRWEVNRRTPRNVKQGALGEV